MEQKQRTQRAKEAPWWRRRQREGSLYIPAWLRFLAIVGAYGFYGQQAGRPCQGSSERIGARQPIGTARSPEGVLRAEAVRTDSERPEVFEHEKEATSEGGSPKGRQTEEGTELGALQGVNEGAPPKGKSKVRVRPTGHRTCHTRDPAQFGQDDRGQGRPTWSTRVEGGPRVSADPCTYDHKVRSSDDGRWEKGDYDGGATRIDPSDSGWTSLLGSTNAGNAETACILRWDAKPSNGQHTAKTYTVQPWDGSPLSQQPKTPFTKEQQKIYGKITEKTPVLPQNSPYAKQTPAPKSTPTEVVVPDSLDGEDGNKTGEGQDQAEWSWTRWSTMDWIAYACILEWIRRYLARVCKSAHLFHRHGTSILPPCLRHGRAVCYGY